jgi:hypothetical protein
LSTGTRGDPDLKLVSPPPEFYQSRNADAEPRAKFIDEKRVTEDIKPGAGNLRRVMKNFEDPAALKHLPGQFELQSELSRMLNRKHRRSSSDPEVHATKVPLDWDKPAPPPKTPLSQSNSKTDLNINNTTGKSRLLQPRGSRMQKSNFKAIANRWEAEAKKSPPVASFLGSPTQVTTNVASTPPSTQPLITSSPAAFSTANVTGQRSYDTYRIPSWTDRILSKVNFVEAKDEVLTQSMYRIGPCAKESDHFPVWASFNLKAAPTPPTRIYQEKAEFWVNDIALSIDKSIAESSRIFEGVGDVYLSFHGVALTQAVSSYTKSMLAPTAGLAALRESGLLEEKQDDLKTSGSLSSGSDTIDIVWDDSDVPSMQFVTSSINFLKSMRIIVSLCRSDAIKTTSRDSILLQAQIFLNPVVENNLWSFESTLSFRGVDAGKLSGRIFIDFKD